MDQTWRKSTFSAANGGACVEVGQSETIVVRDTTNRDGGTLAFGAEAWGTFLSSLR